MSGDIVSWTLTDQGINMDEINENTMLFAKYTHMKAHIAMLIGRVPWPL